MKVRNIELILEMHKNKGVPFNMQQTMFKKNLVSKLGEYEWVAKTLKLKKKDLSFIGVVKKYCEKNNTAPLINRKSISFIRPSALKESYYYKKDIWEIDLTKAHWEFMRQENYISIPIYEKGLLVEKEVRLIAVGNLAKITANLNFDGIKYLKPTFERSLKTENIFFHVCYLTDLLMRKLIVLANEDFLFYWVDAIFVRGKKARDEIIEFLKLNETKFKSYEMNSIIKYSNKIVTFDDKHITEKNPKGKRDFNFRKNNTFVNLIKKEVYRKEETETRIKPEIQMKKNSVIGIQNKLFETEIGDVERTEKNKKGIKYKYDLSFKNKSTGNEFNISHYYLSDGDMYKAVKNNYFTEELITASKTVRGELIKIK